MMVYRKPSIDELIDDLNREPGVSIQVFRDQSLLSSSVKPVLEVKIVHPSKKRLDRLINAIHSAWFLDLQ